jgi:hypothetical protein
VIGHLIRKRLFWLYVGIAITCVAAVLQTLVPFGVTSGLILLGLAIEAIAVWPMIRDYPKEPHGDR